MAKRILIIDGHPDPAPQRLCHGLANAYASGAVNAGHEVRRLELHALDYPLLRSESDFETGKPPPTIAMAQGDISWAEHIVIVYPLWLGTMPALLKGFLEQVIRPDFAFERGTSRWPKKRLKGRTARIVVTMGMPVMVYRWIYLSHSLRSLERNILKFAGISPIRETLFGRIKEVDEQTRNRWIDQMITLGRAGR
jgi:putative NADPH-quinone reductase